MRKSSVILVREWEGQSSGSGCCGRLEGEFLTCDGKPVFRERRAIMDEMGPLYMMLRNRFGEAVDLEVVDPRNVFSLIFLLVRDFLAFRVGVGDALKTLARLPVQAVVINGRLVARGKWPNPTEVVAILDDAASETSRQHAS